MPVMKGGPDIFFSSLPTFIVLRSCAVYLGVGEHTIFDEIVSVEWTLCKADLSICFRFHSFRLA
jgi:hypothetical protein